MKLRYSLISIALLLIGGSIVAAQFNAKVPYVPSPIEVVDRMLEFAAVNQRDVVYDIGSGDGRVVIQAAKKYDSRGVGLELDLRMVEIARADARKQGVEHLVEFRHADALQADISDATVVTLYMLPSFNTQLRPVLERQLKPGARIVTHDYGIEGWKPVKWEEMALVDTRPEVEPHKHIIYYLSVPMGSGRKINC
jgi:SAM-dependent methyltransferase